MAAAQVPWPRGFIRTTAQQGTCYSLVSARPLSRYCQRSGCRGGWFVVEGQEGKVCPMAQALSDWVPFCWQRLLLVPCLLLGKLVCSSRFLTWFQPFVVKDEESEAGRWAKAASVFHLLCPPWYWWEGFVSLSVPAWKGYFKWLIISLLYVQSEDLLRDCLKIWKYDRKPHFALPSPPARVPSDSAC